MNSSRTWLLMAASLVVIVAFFILREHWEHALGLAPISFCWPVHSCTSSTVMAAMAMAAGKIRRTGRAHDLSSLDIAYVRRGGAARGGIPGSSMIRRPSALTWRGHRS